MSTLRYRAGAAGGTQGADPDDLAVGECTLRHTRDASGSYLRLWARVVCTDGQTRLVGCPLNTGGGYGETPRRTWGLGRTAPGIWQVIPSINVLSTGEVHLGPHPTASSLWHETPAIVDVPEPAPWQTP
ncbi:MAG: hypothetical protein KGK07_15220 [Chloroflexota bacterium]|nr:hypothetical protein [Chloroflexota bacterium]